MEKFFYLGQVFDALNTISIAIFIFSVCTALGFGVWYVAAKTNGWDDDDSEVKVPKKTTLYSILVMIVFALIMAFVPEKETWYLMNGGKVIEEVASNEKVKDTATKTLDLINEYLDRELNKQDKDKD